MKTNLLVITGLAALSFVAKYAYQKLFTSNSDKIIPKQIVIQKLIDTQQNLYAILFQIAQIVQKTLIPRDVPPDQAKIFILESQQFTFKQQICKILKQKIYYDITQQQLQHATQQTYKQDKQVQYYKKQFTQQYQKCFLGTKPQQLSVRLLIFNQQKLFQIMARMLRSKLQRLKFIIEQINNNKKNNEQFQQSMEKLEQKLRKDQLQDDKIRVQILKQYHINDIKILQFSVAKFMKQSKQFKQKYIQLQNQYKQEVKKIMKFQ